MFRKILIANRGEIACRVIATARRLGIATVAVHSDADAEAAHVAQADQAVRLGPAPAAESYLHIDRILAAARATGAEAIHPGYGFLSENPDFVDAVEASGLVFIGPSAASIRAMGLKDAAKRLMAEAGVPVVPGYAGPDQDPARLESEARAIGFPVLIKAVAGGGGKGMRRVDNTRDFAASLRAAQGEAEAAFGNSAVLIERYVTAPRHIEIQVFGDSFGNAVHLFERDCSLQRRHQKVIEEAPAPGMPPALRAAMGDAAVKAARAVGYSGAGTVEFIADGSRLRPDGFWFMEMNTRLQVEHPVTEAITGEDLVEWQIRVASGEPLPKTQADLAIRGHAVECRLYAEDPARGFLPVTGRLTHLAFPPGIRADSGVRPGDAITPWYDPMIAKLIAHGPTRESALARLRAGLAQTRIAGSTTNLSFLARLLDDPDFAAARLDTGLIDRKLVELTTATELGPDILAAAALAATGLSETQDPFAGFTLWAPLVQDVHLVRGEIRHAVSVATLGAGRFRIEGREVQTSFDGATLTLITDGQSRRFGIATALPIVTVFDAAESFAFTVPDPLATGIETAQSGDDLRAPMPGLVKRLTASPGQRVAAGDLLVVLEAMKMEHALAAPRDGRVAAVHVGEGEQVEDGALLLALEPPNG